MKESRKDSAFSDGNESLQAISKRVMKNHGLDVILIGNPGAGKSTILSSLSGHEFECGISFEKGKTTEFQVENDKDGRNIRWIDTAGQCWRAKGLTVLRKDPHQKK